MITKKVVDYALKKLSRATEKLDSAKKAYESARGWHNEDELRRAYNRALNEFDDCYTAVRALERARKTSSDNQFYVDTLTEKEDGFDGYGVFSGESPACHASFLTKEEANEYAKKMNRLMRPPSPKKKSGGSKVTLSKKR